MPTGKSSLIEILSLPARDFVKKCFLISIGKLPSHQDIIKNSNKIILGFDRISILTEIYTSAESFGYRRSLWQSDCTDIEFVEQLYKRYLKRPADRDGLEYHVAQLQGRDRRSVEADFICSPEARTDEDLYKEIDELIAADKADRHWWRWLSRQRRRRNLHHEVALHAAARASHVDEKSIATIIRNEIQSSAFLPRGEIQSPISSGFDVNHSSANQIFKSIDEDRIGKMARRTLGRLRTLNFNSSREYV